MTSDRLLRLARAWFAEDIVTRVFEPLVADWEREHQALLGVARVRSTARVLTCFTITAALMLPWQLKQRLPERVTLCGWITSEAFLLIGFVAQGYLFLDANAASGRQLFPALAAAALPLALIPAAVVVSRFATPVETRTMMLRLVLVLMLGMAILLVRWIPNAQPPVDLPRGTAAALLFMPLTVMPLGLAAARFAGRRPALVAVVCWAVTGLVWSTLIAMERPWTAHAVFLAVAVALQRYDKRTTTLVR